MKKVKKLNLKVMKIETFTEEMKNQDLKGLKIKGASTVLLQKMVQKYGIETCSKDVVESANGLATIIIYYCMRGNILIPFKFINRN